MSVGHEIPTIDDPLADALRVLRMDGMFYCPSELTSPWGVDMPRMEDCLWFHVITSGECTLRDSKGVEYRCRQGDVLVLPRGGGHKAFDRPDAETPTVFDLPHEYKSENYAIMRHGGGGDLTTLICGVVRFGHPAARTLLDLLPEVLHISTITNAEQWQWFPSLLSLMAAETRTSRPGGEAVITRLCDILVIQTIREWIDNDAEATHGWIGALRDPLIGQALAQIHREPARLWDVATLAREVGMSRSGFSARFSELVGESPKQYVTRWRMQLAQDLISTSDASIMTIALQLGYQSEAAFSRAFKRVMGSPPSHARRSRTSSFT